MATHVVPAMLPVAFLALLLAAAPRPATAAVALAGSWKLRHGRPGAATDAASGVTGARPAGGVTVSLACGITYGTKATDDKDLRCPAACPYFAQDRNDDQHCTFVCVAGPQCSTYNKNNPVPDAEKGVCRSPMVNYCKEYNLNGTDTCLKCQSFYKLGADGQCHSTMMIPVYILAGVLLAVVVLIVVWLVDLARRPETNSSALKVGLDLRSRAKVRQRLANGRGRDLFPLTTNLCREPAAGAGMCLHFNFQAMVIFWAAVVGCLWVGIAYAVDTDNLIIGTRRFGTPRHNCILVKWGYETQQELMWTKIMFLAIVYSFTFVGTLLHSVRQRRVYQMIDNETVSMKDFVLMCDNLPALDGAEKAEDELTNAAQDALKVKLIGSSICWDFKNDEEDVHVCLDELQGVLDGYSTPRLSMEAAIGEYTGWQKKLFQLESFLFNEEDVSKSKHERKSVTTRVLKIAHKAAAEAHGRLTSSADTDSDGSSSESGQAETMTEKLRAMKSSTNAFLVFDSQEDRDGALKAGSFEFRGQRIGLVETFCEPDTVCWQNFGHAETGQKLMRLAGGIGCIILGLLFWTVFFYAPYAYSLHNFNFDNGQQPGAIYSISFSMVVVVGNAIMYEICARVADNIGFKFKDSRESCYMVLYLVACSFNVALDMVTTYFMAWEISIGLGFRLYDGTRLQHVEDFSDRFESYAMQRILAENAMAYAWPSTYLIPFLIEPVATVVAPLVLMKWIIRSHPEISKHCAESILQSTPMELGRYADLLLNVVLGILIFFFPGGYTALLFFGMVGAHLYIYCYDHYKVLRIIPASTFATMAVDWWSQALTAPICATILSALVFKANCQGHGYCLEDGNHVVYFCVAVWLAHVVVHLLLLVYVVPLLGRHGMENAQADFTYKQVASQIACSWFTANPVHCLRSRYIYNDVPSCSYFVRGKEHTMRLNKRANSFFNDSAAEAEKF
eukprot:TRINITY_DN63676_c0_g1_i1.p1 TRINITY_DN63676_c0_g1~~TRINITY_DN63676_c0_g1_i1.p1  ORF type:complete len:958 (-),score=136.81 TRINITY_DN63676_c0_g1_i1:77-2950(-)